MCCNHCNAMCCSKGFSTLIIGAVIVLSFIRVIWILSTTLNYADPIISLPQRNTTSQLLETSHVSICGRKVNFIDSNIPHLGYYGTKKIVVIGHDNMHHVQTNNHINTILHAMDYALDHDATLAITRSGWAKDVLKTLFGGTHESEDEWERDIARHLNIQFLNQDSTTTISTDPSHDSISYMSGNDMYYYHSSSNISIISERRIPVLQYLWTHVTEGRGNDNMCSAISDSLPEQYVVIHSRWMKHDGCLKRLGSLTQRVKSETGIKIDRRAPCMLDPSYIESILRSSNHSGTPIFIISDGKNPNSTNILKNHPILDVREVPGDLDYVGADMVLGVLASVFIGTPISTLSGNIARARVALGSNPNTNFMFPLKLNENSDDWEFVCRDDRSCLYDTRFLSHYVG